MPINLTAITSLPAPPQKSSPSTFAARADSFLAALPTFGNEVNAAITELNKITSGLDQAEPIAAWLVGTTYDFPDVVAGSDGYSYRCIDTGVVGDNPVTSTTGKWVKLVPPSVPVGAVVAFVGGYFTDAANAGFTNVIGNSASVVNTLLNATGWYVCNGAALNLAGSPIFNTSGRYLPNLTDSRFIMGSTAAGAIGGNNSSAHTHSVAHTHDTTSHVLTIEEIPSHTHTELRPYSGAGASGTAIYGHQTWGESGATGGGLAHNHGATAAASNETSGAASVTENRPAFLACLYIMKVV
jgi:hypothetical protein